MIRPLIALSLILTLLLGVSPVAYAKGFPVSVTAQELTASYQSAKAGGEPLRILIVPGHEPGYGGAVFKGVYEREIVTEIAQKLSLELEKNPNIDTVVARTNDAWSPPFATYFKKEMKKIKSFVKKYKKDAKKKLKKAKGGEQVDHATAPTDVALRLYGINKWANENDIDLVVNLHINDATDHGPDTPGVNSGFALYISDNQYGNGLASRPVAVSIANRLNDLTATSTLRIENQGVVEDQQLIAIGSNNTLRVPTMLIEYGYITEARLLSSTLRNTLTADFAYQTALGIGDYFNDTPSTRFISKALPHTWNTLIEKGTESVEVYALQAALRSLNFYPPSESTLVECPLSGVMNECTEVAIKAYQKSKGFEEAGTLGPLTRASLNKQFGK